MKLYEIHAVLKPALDETAVNNIISNLGETLAKSGFSISSSATKPNEYLTYPIKHFKTGHIVNVEISGPEENVLPEEATAKIKNNENVLRCLTFTKSEQALRKIRAFPSFDQNRSHRETRAPAITEPAAGPASPPTPPVNIEEVDKKLEELLK